MANDIVLAKTNPNDHGTPATHNDDAGRLVIERPEGNVTRVIDVGQAKTVVFDFALDEAKISIYDVDLVLVFPDGAKIILPGFALSIAGIQGADGMVIMAAGQEIDPQRLLAEVGETKIAEVTPLVSVTDLPQSTDDKQRTEQSEQAAADGAETEAQGPGESEPAPPPAPHKVSDRELIEDHPKVDEAPVQIRIPRTEQFTSAATATSSSSSKTADNKDESPPVPVAPPISQDSDVAIKLLAVVDQSRESSQNGGETVTGGFGGGAAASDPSFAVQSAPETIEGSPKDDVIYADNFSLAPAGTTVRVVDVTVTPPTTTAVASSITIGGLPDGVSVIGATKDGDNWVLTMDPADANHVQLLLNYTLPDETDPKDGAGLYARFAATLSFAFGTQAVSLVMVQQFGIGEVTSDADVYRSDPSTGGTLIVLSSVPPGNIVAAGSGNDLVYATQGADAIDGGSGIEKLANEQGDLRRTLGAAQYTLAELPEVLRQEFLLLRNGLDEAFDRAVGRVDEAMSRERSVMEIRLNEHQFGLTRIGQTMTNTLETELNLLSRTLERMRSSLDDRSNKIDSVQQDILSAMRGLDSRAEMKDELRAVAKNLETTIGGSVGALAHAMNDAMVGVAASIERFSGDQEATARKLESLNDARLASQELRALAHSMETGLSSGFGEISRALAAVVHFNQQAARTAELATEPFSPTPPPVPTQTEEAAPKLDRMAAVEEFYANVRRRMGNGG